MPFLKGFSRWRILFCVFCSANLWEALAIGTDPNAPVIEFYLGDTNVFEGTTADVQVRRRGDATGSASATVKVNSGPATPGFPITVRFAPGESSFVVHVPTAENPLPELDRVVELGLTDISGAGMGVFPTAQVRVMDNDGRPGSVANGDGARWQIDESLRPGWTNTYGRMEICAMTVAKDGRVYVGERKQWGAVLAFDKDGVPDRSFGAPVVAPLYVLATQSDGKVLAAGELRYIDGHGVNSIMRFTQDGEFDTTFGWGGNYTAHGIYAVAVQPDDKILISGYMSDSSRRRMARLFKDGGVDPSFSQAVETSYVMRIVLLPDGRILIAYKGTTIVPEFFVSRLEANGASDPTFAQQRAVMPDSFTNAELCALPGGRVLIAFGTELRAVTAEGAIDSEFKAPTVVDGLITALLNLPDGKILVAGKFRHFGAIERSGLARLNADGSVDLSFDPGIGGDVLTACVLGDGSYLVGGIFEKFNTLPVKYLAQIHASVTPRFAIWDAEDGAGLWFSANLGAQVTLDESTDLKTWNFVEKRTLDGFSTRIVTDRSAAVKFVRAKIE